MDRKEQILEYAGPLIEQCFAESCEKIVTDYATTGQQHLNQFYQSFHEVFKKGAETQETYAYLGIFPLHASRLLKTYHLDIKLYTSLFYLEEEPISGSWDAGWLFRYYEEDIEWMKEQLHQKFQHLQAYELEWVETAYIWEYFATARLYLVEHVRYLVKMDAYRELKRSEKFCILFGEFMEQAEILYREGETGNGGILLPDDE